MADLAFYAVGSPNEDTWNQQLAATAPVFFRDSAFPLLSN
jgi:hypothetical protein